jgi:hypothetical protein
VSRRLWVRHHLHHLRRAPPPSPPLVTAHRRPWPWPASRLGAVPSAAAASHYRPIGLKADLDRRSRGPAVDRLGGPGPRWTGALVPLTGGARLPAPPLPGDPNGRSIAGDGGQRSIPSPFLPPPGFLFWHRITFLF